MPTITYSEEEYSALEAEIRNLRQTNAYLESQRPIWAMGYTSESVTTQNLGNALSQIWNFLGVTNQTQAMYKLAKLSNLKPSLMR